MVARFPFARCVLLGVIASLAVAEVARSGPDEEGNRYAVLVGVKTYDHAKLDALEFTENDVTDLADVLRPAGYQVVLLTDTTGKNKAQFVPTRANIDKRLQEVLDKCKRHDLVLVAFAGHGLQFEKDPDCYFCPKDAHPFPEKTATLVSLASVYERLDRCGAGVKLLLVDACRNDPAAGRGRGVANDVLDKTPPKGVFAFFSCSPGERAFEHKDLKHGVFFYHILQGLKSEVKDPNGQVTFEGLSLHVRRQVPRQVGQLFGAGTKQTPTLKVVEVSGEPVVILSRQNNLLRTDLEEVHRASLRGYVVLRRSVAKLAPERIAVWRETAERGVAEGQYLYGTALHFGEGIANNETEAIRWLRKAAEQGFNAAQSLLAHCYIFGLGVTKDEKEAVRWLGKAAEQGDPIAQDQLGHCFAFGWGVAKADKEAAHWYRKAADQECALGQDSLGACYLKGKGVSKNETEGVKWVRKAAEQDYAIAQYRLGLCYANGFGVTKDETEAIRWYRKAAEQGFAEAESTLGLCFRDGVGVAKDVKEAVRWYRKAAEQGVPVSQVNLGTFYLNGVGVAKDEKEAVRWFRKAADQDDAYAAFWLSYCYMKGVGVSKDEIEAVGWLRKSAEYGYPAAQRDLGACYLRGVGVTRDPIEAVIWYRKAAAQGDPIAIDTLKQLGVRP